jgi:hypothetical protein
MTMGRAASILTFAAILHPTPTSPCQFLPKDGEAQLYSLSISQTGPAMVSGMPALLLIMRLTNKSDSDLNTQLVYLQDGEFMSAHYEVHDALGNPVPRMFRKPPPDISVIGLFVKSKKTSEFSVTMDRGYDLSTPGSYTVRACIGFVVDINEERTAEVCSNTITVKVFPARKGGVH